jgi:GxxExxY protein
MGKILFPNLSYKIVGILYEVYNELGYGYQEKYYQKAIALRLEKEDLKFKEQLKINLNFDSRLIGKYFLDFLIENKIVLEIKVGDYFYKKDYEQVRGYLKSHRLQLGIIALFSKEGVKVKRILYRHSNKSKFG